MLGTHSERELTATQSVPRTPRVFRTPGFLGSLGRDVTTASWRSGWPPGGRGRVPESQGPGLLTLVFPSAQRRAALQAWRWSAVPTAAPARCSDLQEGIVCQEDQAWPAGLPLSSRVGAPLGHGRVAQREGRGEPWGVQVGISSEAGHLPAGSLEQDGGCVPRSTA